jgi:hypothetical protein
MLLYVKGKVKVKLSVRGHSSLSGGGVQTGST